MKAPLYKPRLIDYKLLNNDLKLKTLTNELIQAKRSIDSTRVKAPVASVTSSVKVATIVNRPPYIPVFYKKTSILFNLILGLIIIFLPLFLYYRYKTKLSKFEKDKRIIDVVSNINLKIGL